MTYFDQLAELSDHDASIWLDSLGRGRLSGGGLAALVRGRHVVGVTTNPTIFEQALADSAQYGSQVHDLGLRGASPEEAARSAVTDHAGSARKPFKAATRRLGLSLKRFPCVGVDYADVMCTLERGGVQKFANS
jgi:transaldolase